MKEEWREIDGYPAYEVSDLGNVRSHKRGLRLLRQIPNGTGYLRVGLYAPGSEKCRLIYVHRLVLDAFRGAPLANEEGSHMNGNRSDNRLSNLKWESRSKNLLRRREHGTSPTGSANNAAKLNESKVQDIRRRYREGGVSMEKLGARYGVTATVICRVVNRQSWNHVE